MVVLIQWVVLTITTLYQRVAIAVEDRQLPPGELVELGSGGRLHLYTVGTGSPTIVLDHSLGGVEGYLLIEALSALSRVCIYDRAGYGWSDQSGRPRNSEVIVQELDELLTRAGIEPPYVLVGNSFGSYNVRLYAHRFPQKVVGLVLTDGLHESGMLKMSFALQALKLLFVSGFVMSVFGAFFGVIRSLKTIGLFTLLKPELRRFPETAIERVQRSFCRAKHWVTMSRELINLDQSGRQVAIAQNFGTMPIVSIQSASFFKPALWTRLIPLKAANQLRAEMHLKFQMLSENVVQIEAKSSGHFVWTDEPELVVEAVRRVLEK